MGKYKIIRVLLERIGLLNDKISIRKRVRAFFIYFVIIPIVLIIAIYYKYSMNFFEKEVSKLALKSLNQAKSNIHYRLENIAEILSSIMAASYPYINRPVQADSLSQQIDDFQSLINILQMYENRNMISRLRLFVEDDKIYSRQKDVFFSLSDLHDYDKLLRDFSNGRQVAWQDTYLYRDMLRNEESHIISCIFSLRSIEDYNTFSAVLYADIKEESISNILDVGLDYNESVFLLNTDGVVISHKNKAMIGSKYFSDQEMAEMIQNRTGIMKRRINESTEIAAYDKISYPEWFIVTTLLKEQIYGKGMESFSVSSMFSMVLVLIIFVISVFILFIIIMESSIMQLHSMVRRIDSLGMEALGVNNIKNKNVPSIFSLENHVNELIETIKNILEDSYKSKIAVREAQFKALQAQINPHFLYNTLDTIKWMAMDSQKENTIWMIDSLSKYFRLSLSGGQDIVSIQDEYTLALVYLGMQKKRFSNRFDIICHVDKNLFSYKIPKLTLQPIIENAIFHGLQKNKFVDAKITIAILMDEDIIIEVSDNGIGMSEETVNDILSGRSMSKGYGLSNVVERIKLFCGNRYNLSILSEPGVGTTVTLRISPQK